MPVVVQERFESRRVKIGTNPSAELKYWIQGAATELEARANLLSNIPATYQLDAGGTIQLPLLDYEVEPMGVDLWDAVVMYGWQAQAQYSFDTTGGTQKITQSRATAQKYALPGKTPPDFKGAIGVTNDSVEGCEVTVPVYAFAETYYLADSIVTPAYKQTIYNLTGCVNTVAYKGYQPGELLFLGAQGAKNGYLEGWSVQFRFAASPNQTSLTMGEITGIDKKGWEYLWVRYQEAEDTAAKALIRKPVAVYIEEVYRKGDLTALGI